MTVRHEKEKNRFTMDINGDIARVDYQLKDNKMYLTYSEIPYHLRGQGYGKILVEKTFEQLTKEGYNAKAVCSYIRAVARRSDKWNTIIE
ncbi:GNAT family N-acetyltransferase [Arenibacter certesii]|nr:GNAT family N-acetyltransferase [Arenibacter certesii]